MSRRSAIRLAMAGGLGGLGVVSTLRDDLGLSRTLSAQAGAPPVVSPRTNPKFPLPPAWNVELRELRPNVFAYIHANGPGVYPDGTRFAGGRGIANAGVVVGDVHLLVIDTMGQPLHVKAFKEAIKKTIGDKPFGRVVNTHHHSDHVNGNQFFVPIEIVGHTFCRQMVLQMAASLPPDFAFVKFEGAAEGTEVLKLTPPTTTFTDKLTYVYGGTVVELLHLGVAHTWGDVVAYLPEHKIMFAGDIACFHIAPFSHQGQVTSWLTVIDKVLDMDVETIIPGHGPIGGKKELAELREYFAILIREARKRFDAGMSPGKAAADIKMGKFDNWIGAERVLLNTCRLYEEFSGALTPNLDIGLMTKAAEEFNAIQEKRKA